MATRDQLIAKAEGVCTAITTMPAKQRLENPIGTFGREYNNFRTQVANAFPELVEILPPPVEFRTPAIGNIEMTVSTYAEIHSYYEQIKNLLHDSNR